MNPPSSHSHPKTSSSLSAVWRFILLIIALCLLVFGLYTQIRAEEASQSSSSSPVETLPGDAVQEIRPTAIIKQSVILAEQQARPVEVLLDGLDDLPSDVSLEGVQIAGYGQFVTVQDKRIGQLVLSALRKGSREVNLDPGHFYGQFDLEKPELDRNRRITLTIDRDQLIAALRALGKEETDPEEPDDKTVQRITDQEGGGTASGAVNDQAAAYQTPERIAAEADPKISVETTTEGCSVRVDYTQQAAIQQSKTVYYEDGARTDEDACSDSEVRYPLQKSYEVCSDAVDLPGLQATAQYTWFYVDQGQARRDVSDCQPDAEKIFSITEKQSCSVDLDFENKQALIQTALVYNNINGLETKVRDCEASPSIPPLPLTQNTDTCAMRHHFDAGYSEEMGTWIYDYEGVIYQATLCTNTEVTFTHEKVYKTAAGTDLCTVAVNMDSKQAVPMYRLQITVGSQPQFISECTPDEGGSLSIVATTEGCEDPNLWDHDVGAGISYAKERFYYENPNRIYVTDCVRSGATYNHSHQTTGYQNHDDVKASYALTTASINVNEVPFEVTSSQVLPGATLIPYAYQEVRDEVIDNTYAGCDVVRTTAATEVYLRPDETEYFEVIGEGSPIGPMDVCGTIIQTPVWAKYGDYQPTPVKVGEDKHWKTLCWGTTGGEGGYYDFRPCEVHGYIWQTRQGYNGKRIMQREDGVEITQTSKSTHYAGCYQMIRSKTYSDWKGGPNSLPNPTNGHQDEPKVEHSSYPCPATYTGVAVYAWNQAEGW